MVSHSCKRPVSPKPKGLALSLGLPGRALWTGSNHPPPPWLSFKVTITVPHGSPWVHLSATQQTRLCLQNNESGIGFSTTSRVPRVSVQLTAHLAPAMIRPGVPGTQQMPAPELLHLLLPIRERCSCTAPPQVSDML